MENNAKLKEVPTVIRMEVSGNDCDETIFIDQSHSIISIYAYLSDWEGRKAKHYKAIKENLVRDLRETRSCGFNPVPKNLPKEIFSYILNRSQVHGEGFLGEFIQLTVYSDDRGLCHWFMDSEAGQLFLGDKSFPVPKFRRIK